jgi:chromosome segregation ATPase
MLEEDARAYRRSASGRFATVATVVLDLTDHVDARFREADVRFDRIESELGEVKQDVTVLKRDMTEVKQDVTVLKQDVMVLKRDMTEVRQDVTVLKRDMTEVKQDLAGVKQDVSKIALQVDHLPGMQARLEELAHWIKRDELKQSASDQ